MSLFELTVKTAWIFASFLYPMCAISDVSASSLKLVHDQLMLVVPTCQRRATVILLTFCKRFGLNAALSPPLLRCCRHSSLKCLQVRVSRAAMMRTVFFLAKRRRSRVYDASCLTALPPQGFRKEEHLQARFPCACF